MDEHRIPHGEGYERWLGPSLAVGAHQRTVACELVDHGRLIARQREGRAEVSSVEEAVELNAFSSGQRQA